MNVPIIRPRIVETLAAVVNIDDKDRVAALATIAFDTAVRELFLPLVNGARIVIAERTAVNDPTAIGELIERHGITIIGATPSTWRMLVFNECPKNGSSLKAFVGGEALSSKLAASIRGRVKQLWNIYGPTETTIWAATQFVDGATGANPGVTPIGRPIANKRIYILDADGEPVPVGVAGEIFIGGVGVARGYLNRPELTETRFLPDPFAISEGAGKARMYRTGDLGRWLPDGTIEFLGRNDHQVKIRGFRVELGEIEARLLECPGVREAVVTARDQIRSGKRLVAYFTSEANEAEMTAADLRRRLAKALPDHMVPAAYVRLDRLPLTPNGKTTASPCRRHRTRHSVPVPMRRRKGSSKSPSQPIGRSFWASIASVDTTISLTSADTPCWSPRSSAKFAT